MAQWSKKYTPPANLNGGAEYTIDSDVTLDTFNVANNNAFYAVEQSKKATETANNALEHAQKNGTQTFINNKFQSRLDFTSDPQSQIDGKQPKGDYALKTAIPKNLSQLTADSTHRVVTDNQINTWNNKSNFSGNYNDLSNKPTIPSIKVNNIAQTTLSFTTDPQTQINTLNSRTHIVQSYKSSDGNVKWRKWNDGLIEYWINLPNPSVYSHTFTGVNFTNTNYSVFVGFSGSISSTTVYYAKISIKTKSTTSISFQDAGVSGIARYIYVAGY